MKKLYSASLLYLILGLSAGVFFREFTKFSKYTGITSLKGLHPHLLVLGFIFFLILMLTANFTHLHEHKHFNQWYIVYNVGLLWTTISMAVRGILQVKGTDFNGLPHIAGTGHFILGAALIWFMIILKKHIITNK
ncbi:DUF2871 domain-containing protein [Clostridium polynesiense]|uniref:DUF2871 domain-containing protein n=1 Tax=Clostridium polynesiense TaxID=1325933 RepID=UPI00058F15C5|nr:DUF2871 domain-containing protein [Clostridium polynesiense]